MNYIEFEIGGKLRGFKFGTRFLGNILETLETDISGLGEQMDSNPFKVRPLSLYLAHKAHCEGKGMPITFELDDVNDWIDDIDNGVSNVNVIECMRILVESIRGHLPTSDDEPKGQKKN